MIEWTMKVVSPKILITVGLYGCDLVLQFKDNLSWLMSSDGSFELHHYQ